MNSAEIPSPHHRGPILLACVAGVLVATIVGVFVLVHPANTPTSHAQALAAAKTSIAAVSAAENTYTSTEKSYLSEILSGNTYAATAKTLVPHLSDVIPGGDITQLRTAERALAQITANDAKAVHLSLKTGTQASGAGETPGIPSGKMPTITTKMNTRALQAVTTVEEGRRSDWQGLIDGVTTKRAAISSPHQAVTAALKLIIADIPDSASELETQDTLAAADKIAALQSSTLAASSVLGNNYASVILTYANAAHAANASQKSAKAAADATAAASAAAEARREAEENARQTPTPTPTPLLPLPTPTPTATPSPTSTPTPTPEPTNAP